MVHKLALLRGETVGPPPEVIRVKDDSANPYWLTTRIAFCDLGIMLEFNYKADLNKMGPRAFIHICPLTSGHL